MRGLFIFRQDLRVHDNTGLRNAIQENDEIIPVFIFDTEILQHFPAKDKRLAFLKELLDQLDQQLKAIGSRLFVHYGKSKEVVADLVAQYGCQSVYVNKSYGENSLLRDSYLRQRCREKHISYKEYADFLLVEPDEIRPYKVYTPFYNVRIKQVQQKYQDYTLLIPRECNTPRIEHDNTVAYKKVDAGDTCSRSALDYQQRLEQFRFNHYEETRNTPSIDGSSKLSPYIRFGSISIRQLYFHILSQYPSTDTQGSLSLSTYIKELARREFWHHIAIQFPTTRELEFQEKRRSIKRENNPERFRLWQEGKTGYPLVDAGMRQLRQENWMHNRVRMVVASFLCKDLLIDRRWGEKEFARYLIDYDSNVNIGNRQWAASVGADPKPLRIFNPLLQSQRFDPDCSYIKTYIPELTSYSPAQIHDPLSYKLDYAPPVINHYERSKIAKERYGHSQVYYQTLFSSSEGPLC